MVFVARTHQITSDFFCDGEPWSNFNQAIQTFNLFTNLCFSSCYNGVFYQSQFKNLFFLFAFYWAFTHQDMVVHTCDSVFIHFYISKIHNKQNNHIKRFVTTKCCSTFFYSHLIEQVLTMNVVHELRHESEFTHMRTASALLIHFKRYSNKCVLGYLNSMLWARALSTGRTGRLTNLTIAWIVSLFSCGKEIFSAKNDGQKATININYYKTFCPTEPMGISLLFVSAGATVIHFLFLFYSIFFFNVNTKEALR